MLTASMWVQALTGQAAVCFACHWALKARESCMSAPKPGRVLSPLTHLAESAWLSEGAIT